MRSPTDARARFSVDGSSSVLAPAAHMCRFEPVTRIAQSVSRVSPSADRDVIGALLAGEDSVVGRFG